MNGTEGKIQPKITTPDCTEAKQDSFNGVRTQPSRTKHLPSVNQLEMAALTSQ